MTDIPTLLNAVIALAPDARRSGIASFQVGDFACTFTPWQAPVDDAPGPVQTVEEPSAAMSNPLTYGLQPGDKVPGFEPPERPAPQEGDDE